MVTYPTGPFCVALNIQSMLKNMTMLRLRGEKGRNWRDSFHWAWKARACPLERDPLIGFFHFLFSPFSFILFHFLHPFLVFVSLSWQWEAKPPIIGSLTTKHSWCNDSNYLLNAILVLLFFLYLLSCLWFDHPCSLNVIEFRHWKMFIS